MRALALCAAHHSDFTSNKNVNFISAVSNAYSKEIHTFVRGGGEKEMEKMPRRHKRQRLARGGAPARSETRPGKRERAIVRAVGTTRPPTGEDRQMEAPSHNSICNRALLSTAVGVLVHLTTCQTT